MSIRNWGRVYGELSIMYEEDSQNNGICMHDEKDVFDVRS